MLSLDIFHRHFDCETRPPCRTAERQRCFNMGHGVRQSGMFNALRYEERFYLYMGGTLRLGLYLTLPPRPSGSLTPDPMTPSVTTFAVQNPAGSGRPRAVPVHGTVAR